ncbi:MAG: ABC transporter ATP-binding protein [Dermatophilaceae bacterium]
MGQDDVAVALRQVRKEFPGSPPVVAVDGIDLEVRRGEFFSVLGPSGSGKTTVLRMIAGFEEPSAGVVILGGTDVTAHPPHRRNVNTVFQDYALFPHLSVLDNVEYGLRVAGVATAERRRRAGEALDQVRLTSLGGRRPSQLSGGQRQRVALARALVNRPEVLLLDEPLGALDLTLREQMQVELKAIQRDVGITFLFVTHDQDEALTLSDRVAVLDAGRVEQVGTARDVYERPASAFVAGFVGTSNLLSGAAARAILGTDGTVGIRPEKIRLELPGSPGLPRSDDDVRAPGTLTEIVYAGPVTRYVVDVAAGGRLVVLEQNGRRDPPDGVVRGAQVELRWAPQHLIHVSGPT